MGDFEREVLAAHTPCDGMDDARLLSALARTHAELILIHPFREGNGRLTRLLNTLMALRNRVVSLVGLKNLGHLGEIKDKPVNAYRVGDRVGIFSLRYLSENEIILGDSDKPLIVCVSIYKQSIGEQHSVALSTVVHIHNTLGRVYMFFVAPAHKIIAPAVLAKGL